MKMLNIDLVQIINILNDCGSKKLPQKISFAITKNITKLNQDFEIYQKSLQKILEDYRDFYVYDEEGKPKTYPNGIPEVDEEHQSALNKEISDLLNIEIDVDIYQIDDELFNYDDSDRYDALSAGDILNLQRVLCHANDDNEDKKE